VWNDADVVLSAGTLLGYRYRLGASLGQGGAAQAYRAHDLLEQRPVALKLLSAARPVDELRREFELLRGLVHPHLTRVHEFGVAVLGSRAETARTSRHERERRAFYTAELLPGGDLRAFSARARPEQLMLALCDVLDALHLLHRLGLRHGDVKPENVLVDERGRAVLIDLGCAAALGQSAITLSGTPGYLAPELREGQPADERADLFAFGVMLRELCPPSLRSAHQPVVAQLTAPRAGERPSSAREALAMLGDTRDVESSTRGRAPRCIARDDEIELAHRALTQAARGEAGPRCVWIEGRPGVGRSRVLREICFLLACAEVELLEARAVGDRPLRDALLRRDPELAPGFEALLDALSEPAALCPPCAWVLDDAERLTPDASLELRFVLAALPEAGRTVVLVASTQPPPALDQGRVLCIQLGPLELPALRTWSRGVLDPARVPDLLRFTGGYPRYVERTLAALVDGRLREAELVEPARASVAGLDEESARSLALAVLGLSPGEQRTLGEIALLGTSTHTPSPRLFARDLITAQGDGLRLVRQADTPSVLASLPAELVRALHNEAARVLQTSDQPERQAAAIESFVRAGRLEQARLLLERLAPHALRTPRPFARSLSSLVDELAPAQRVFTAQLLRLSGESARALKVLAGARRVATGTALFVEAAEAYLALGRPQRAERMLARLPETSEHAELRARVLVRRGAYERAREVAQQALESAADPVLPPVTRARLLEALALALSYLDQLTEARAKVDEALALHPGAEVRARARCLSLRGLVSLRAGAHAEAAVAYADAFKLAEAHGLADLVVNTLSNLGNARQSLGQWGAALESYERALRLARALGRRASVRSLRANLANLALEIGSFERAESELSALVDTAAGSGESAALSLSLTHYRAELALLKGDPAETLRLLSQPAPSMAPRERVETAVYTALAQLALGEPQRALASIEQQRSELHGDGTLPLDLLARLAEVEAYALLACGRAQSGVEQLEQALASVRPSGDQALLARLETALWELYRGLSANALASDCAARARGRWERIAIALPKTLREAFWAHPRRARLHQEGPPEVSNVTRSGRATLSLSRVRELNRRIGVLHEREAVLAFALDAAIELTGAERGFVLLPAAGERGFVVAAAQNMEGARMKKSEWKWSRSIAERVIRLGEPVLTVDAGSDPRFARQASVHAMQLKSVLCAPIRGQSAVRGALYLDNRLARARFAQEDAELLLTFADQVAIALTHAELVEQLTQKAQELASEKRKVEALARGQALQIERLADELTAQKANLATRYDYEAIVGRSEPMRRVLAVLDRVVDTDLSVLIQGESGTGKELIARALHNHGKRKHKPFVGINCAALPEPLLESELFGHVKGAFTGASSSREGLFVTARGGVLFLDELGELPLSMQAKLLRVLSDGEVRPVGATKSQAVDVRLVCATNRQLRQRVAEGAFREDLYYRVGVVELTLPPLRERHEDIVPIAEAILRARAAETHEPVKKLRADAVRALLSHPWPGNVRELQNTLLRATVMATSGIIRAEDLSLSATGAQLRNPSSAVASTRGEYAQKEAERLLSALTAERWNVSKVAKSLGIPRNTLYRKLARHGIHREGD
jgi:serine/threonine-protein kinase PknK